MRVRIQLGPAGRGLPPEPTTVQDPRIAFTLPTAAELEDAAQWSVYLRSHNNFNVAYDVYRMGVLIGWLEGNLQSERIAVTQRQAADEYVKALRERQNVLIDAFQK